MLKLKLQSERNIALKLYDYFTQEAGRGRLFYSVKNPEARTRHALGLSKTTFKRWINERSDNIIKEPKFKRSKVDSFDKDVIRRVIHSMFDNKVLITLRKLKAHLAEHNDINIGKTLLWKTVRRLGFTFRKTKTGKNLICERLDLVAARCRYLRKIKEYREQGLNVIYQDETWINAHHTNEKEWMSKDGSKKRQIPSSKGERVIISHAGSSEKGFVPDAELVFRSKSKDNRDYHSEMDGHNFKKWVQEKLLPNVHEKSLFVLDNASYHNFVDPEDQIPTNAWKLVEIREWFRRQNIDFNEKSFKYELLIRIKAMNLKKVYAIDKIFHAHGHEVLRLPPYHSHLNPIELVWAKVKRQVAN